MVVIDASVAFKWFDTSEDLYVTACDLLEAHLEQKTEIVVPDLILYELTNAWATKTKMTTQYLMDNLRIFEQYIPEPIPVSYQFIEECGTFAKQYSVSVYDAVYVILAKDYGCDLITADARFVTRVNLPFIKLLSRYSI